MANGGCKILIFEALTELRKCGIWMPERCSNLVNRYDSARRFAGN